MSCPIKTGAWWLELVFDVLRFKLVRRLVVAVVARGEVMFMLVDQPNAQLGNAEA
jgi:hypothetical protein